MASERKANDNHDGSAVTHRVSALPFFFSLFPPSQTLRHKAAHPIRRLGLLAAGGVGVGPQDEARTAAARHLAQLKNIDYPDVPSSELTPEEMKVIANRYNMGSSLSLEEIEQYDYGIRFWDRLADMDKLLYPDKG